MTPNEKNQKTQPNFPILYTFRRCPYAMRARLAIWSARVPVELREVKLQNKPPELLQASPKGTVPVLVLPSGQVIDESLNIARWALEISDPEGWLNIDQGAFSFLHDQVEQGTGSFKVSLDRYKYHTRYPEHPRDDYREQAESFLRLLEKNLTQRAQILSTKTTLADVMIFPFVRQFANVDRRWFDQSDYPNVQRWLKGHLDSELFKAVMYKHPIWSPEDAPIYQGKL